MPRLLTNDLCRVAMYDRISDSEIELFYDPPSPEEKIAYDNAIMTRKGRSVTSNLGQARMKFGAKKLKGIGDNSFVQKKDGKTVPLHSREGSDYYSPDWHAQVVAMAPDIVSALAVHIFEGSLERTEGEEVEAEAGGDPT